MRVAWRVSLEYEFVGLGIEPRFGLHSAEPPAPDAAARIVDEGDGVYEVTLAAPAAAGAYDVMVAAADADATAPPPALASAGVVYVT